MSILYHPSVKDRLEAIAQDLPQSILLTGETGIGLATIARYLATEKESFTVSPELLTKTSTIPQIGVETIRGLYEAARTKAAATRVIIIDDADMMTHAAQNSFLKLLEEPNQHTRFILTSHHPERLLPTVRSRSQTLYLPRLSPKQSEKLIDSFGSLAPREKVQIKFVAEGLPAEISRLVADTDYFSSMVLETTLAKKLIESTKQEVLPLIFSMNTQRDAALRVIERMIYLLNIAPSVQGVSRIQRLLNAYDDIRNGGNIRLQLTAAMV